MRDLSEGPIARHLPAIWLSTLPGFVIDHVGYLSVASVWAQSALSLFLLSRVMRTWLAPLVKRTHA